MRSILGVGDRQSDGKITSHGLLDRRLKAALHACITGPRTVHDMDLIVALASNPNRHAKYWKAHSALEQITAFHRLGWEADQWRHHPAMCVEDTVEQIMQGTEHVDPLDATLVLLYLYDAIVARSGDVVEERVPWHSDAWLRECLEFCPDQRDVLRQTVQLVLQANGAYDTVEQHADGLSTRQADT